MKTQGLCDPCACTTQDEHCTIEQYLFVDTLKKKILNNREDCAGKRLCCVQVMFLLLHVSIGRTCKKGSSLDEKLVLVTNTFHEIWKFGRSPISQCGERIKCGQGSALIAQTTSRIETERIAR